MSEQAVRPLDPFTLAPPRPTGVALARLEDELRQLEDELQELDRRKEAAQRRLEVEDLASPFPGRSIDLGRSFAQDILRQGRADIRGLLAEAQSAAEARSADALREAQDILAEARAEVAEAMEDRAGGVEGVLMAPAAPGAPREVPSGHPHDPAVVVALLEASISEFVAVPLGASIDSPPQIDWSAPSGRSDPLAAVRRPDPPDPADSLDPVDASLPVSAVSFADFSPPDLTDPFVGDTPATTSVHIEALADLAGIEISELPTAAEAEAVRDAEASSDADCPEGTIGAFPGASFWGEQEAAKHTRWLRPVEILVPMVLALVLFVALLLWIG